MFLFCVFSQKNNYLVPVLVLLPLCDAVLLGDILALWHHLGVLNGVHALGALLPKVILADLKLKLRDKTFFTFPKRIEGLMRIQNSNTTYMLEVRGGGERRYDESECLTNIELTLHRNITILNKHRNSKYVACHHYIEIFWSLHYTESRQLLFVSPLWTNLEIFLLYLYDVL